MKYLLNKRYITYLCLISLVLILPVMFNPQPSFFFMVLMMVPPLIGWLMMLERKRTRLLATLQNALNELPIHDLRLLAQSLNLSVKTLRNLSEYPLTHQQITLLKHTLSLKE